MAATMAGKNLVLSNLLVDLSKCTDKPEVFLSEQKDLASKIKSSVKISYDYLKETEEDAQKSDALPELIVKDFDDEQIWQELELQNEPSVNSFLKDISTLLGSKSKSSLTFTTEEEDRVENIPEDEMEGSDSEESEDEEDNSSEGDVSDLDLKSGSKSGADAVIDWDDEDSEGSMNDFFDTEAVEEDDDSESDDDMKPDTTDKKVNRTSKKKKSVVDDKFFNLADMAAFLDQEDAKEERKMRQTKRKKQDDDSEDLEEDDNIGLFDDEDDDEGGLDIKYDDFFDAIDDGGERSVKFKDQEHSESEGEESDEMEEEEEEEGSAEEEEEEDEEGSEEHEEGSGDEEDSEEDQVAVGMKSRKQQLIESESDISEGEDVEDILGHKETKSSFEQRQERLRNRIKDMEAASMKEKPWQLLGEAGGTTRPQNSLLEEDLQFEHTGRTAPVITEETTQSLEDIIKQRIKDKSWDDVERKVRKKEEVFEYKKRITLDQEKSKASLGEIYEKEYLKLVEEGKEEEVNPAHEDIRKTMQALFIKLDALSNFHYTPKPAVPDVKIVSNLPSINMEEVAPVSVSDAAMLAPEEVKEKSHAPEKGDTEKTTTDRKRARRNKKAEKRAKRKEKEQRQKMVEKLNPGLGNKYSKKKAMEELEKISKTSGGVTLIKDKNSKVPKSSKAFFSQLQDEVKTQVRSKNADRKIKAKDSGKSSKKFKL